MNTETLKCLDYQALIEQGINEGKGQPEDLELLKPEWLIELGIKAANLGQKKRMKFPSWIVEPMNDIDEAYGRGHYTGKYDWISNKTVALSQVAGKKRVYVVPFNRTTGPTEYVNLLAEHGLKPCVNAPNYLPGLMAQVPEAEMPEELRRKDIAAAEPNNPSSVFQDWYGIRCFLYADRHDGDRRLHLVDVGDDDWHDDWAFLAEDA